MTSSRVLVVPPYLPEYRVRFFERLTARIQDRGVEVTVAHGSPTGSLAQRHDTGALPGALALPQRVFRVGGRTLLWRDLGALARRCDAVVLEQALRNLEAFPLMVRSRLHGGPAICLWGHGGTYTHRQSAAERAVKDAFTRRADWFFAYTEGGSRYATRAGVPAERVTVVRNSTDTAALQTALAQITPQQLRDFRARHGLTTGRSAFFIGGLDAPKRIPFLLAAAELTARRLPGFRLLVAGDGAHRRLVEDAAARPSSSVVFLGPVQDAGRKALLGAACDVLLMPGAVGLVAVDALALSTPVITTPDAAHGPEFEYLEDGRNACVVTGDESKFADTTAALLIERTRLEALRRGCQEDAVHYSGEAMSARFAEGLLAVLAMAR
ncbi:glycosyltransferase family 4 protein [Streptomyces sp. TRM68367]|uniref:glycosyltransferase family 4 protein n=1 Tax=Streptomyces sp. TRM68367 TaxID=2758415 RepID=UPI00165A48E1|nr:glycosyltransferase family 4 protein [Streptomyces sp. TRM68367]MBC9726989.1 glycosyltransferase family 4 protein [Streptomyces sp. TRM68367]